MSNKMTWLDTGRRKVCLAIPERYRAIAGTIIFWIVPTAVLVLQTGVVPRTKLGWIVMAALGAILCAAGAIVIVFAVSFFALVNGSAERVNEIATTPDRKPAILSRLARRLTPVLLFGAVIALAGYLAQLTGSPASWFWQNFSIH